MADGKPEKAAEMCERYLELDPAHGESLYNLALAGVPGMELPLPMNVPRFGGSIFGGALLIVAGFILLLHTKFGYSLDWVQDWWPVAPILLGVYLIGRALHERAGSVESP